MITYQKGNILHNQDQAGAIINTVDTVGVMGKGLALQFKKLSQKTLKYTKKPVMINLCHLSSCRLICCLIF